MTIGRAVWIGLCCLYALDAAAANERSGWRTPPADLVQLADAPLPPLALAGPGGQWILLGDTPPLVPTSELAQPELKLGGLRFNPDNHGQTRAGYASRLGLVRTGDAARRAITGLPAEARLRNLAWSPDGKWIAFTHTSPTAVELWVAEVASGAARRLGDLPLNAVHPSAPLHWLPDSQGLVVRAVPADLPPLEPPPRAPTGPTVDENLGKRTPAPTFQDLLKNEHDAALLERYLTAEIWRVRLDGNRQRLGAAALTMRAEPSPDGRYLLVETLHRPFSYLVTVERFPRRVEVLQSDGKRVAELADLPLADQIPIDFSAARTGRRDFAWRDDADAALSWVEAQDGGDPRRPAKVRDKLFLLAAPFRGAPVELAALSLRFVDVRWGDDQLAIVVENWWNDRKLREWRIAPGQPARPPVLLSERSFEDRYADPGMLVMEPSARGRSLLRSDGGKVIYRSGPGASPEGLRPFIDRVDLASQQKTRLFRSDKPYFEQPIELLPDGRHLVTRRESLDAPPNLYLRDLDGGKVTALTTMPHPYPQLKGVKKELIRYRRKDGVALSGTLYLPPGYTGNKRLPVLLFAYPVDFKSADAASQINDSPYRFPRINWGSPLYWLARGYAILDNPAFPIVGEGKQEPNDTYVEQLVADAQAAVDELVRRGVGDRDRMAIAGHSYGAFTTANLLAHSRLFRAGIARSGAYNRTLTPFGFQTEQRTFWEVPKTYIDMSPFTHAASIDDPLLLIHGSEDNNTGTFPMQSERLFQALKGLGKTTRLVMLPHEAHGYRGRESVLHMLWEMDTWLEKYVKNARPRPPATAAVGSPPATRAPN